MKRRTFFKISGLAAGSLFLPAPLLAQGAAPEQAARIFEALRAHSAGDCPAHHHEGIAHLTLPLPDEVSKSRVVGMKRVGAQAPAQSALAQHYPDPVRTTTTIPFSLAQPGFVDLRIYNTWGQRVVSLVKGDLPAGAYEVVWDVHDLAEGPYQSVLETGTFVASRRMTVGASRAVVAAAP